MTNANEMEPCFLCLRDTTHRVMTARGPRCLIEEMTYEEIYHLGWRHETSRPIDTSKCSICRRQLDAEASIKRPLIPPA